MRETTECPFCRFSIPIESEGRTSRCPNCQAALPLSPQEQPEPPPKSKRFGRYVIERLLGSGGMGKAYLAFDELLDRKVALKIPSRLAIDDKQMRERFFREARAAAGLSHPNICQIYDIGETGGTLFLSMEFVDGPTLAEYAKGERMPLKKAVRLVIKIANAVCAAHESGVIHRDLKPANILIPKSSPSDAPEPKVTDFGLARRIGSSKQLTQSGMILGTPRYMPREQWDASSDRITPAADVYSLGVILYELLTGATPYEIDDDAPATAWLAKMLTEKPVPAASRRSELDCRLDAICRKATARDPEDRYGSMAEFASELQSWIDPNDGAQATALANSSRRLPHRRFGAGIALSLAGVACVSIVTARVLRPAAEVDKLVSGSSQEESKSTLGNAESPLKIQTPSLTVAEETSTHEPETEEWKRSIERSLAVVEFRSGSRGFTRVAIAVVPGVYCVRGSADFEPISLQSLEGESVNTLRVLYRADDLLWIEAKGLSPTAATPSAETEDQEIWVVDVETDSAEPGKAQFYPGRLRFASGRAQPEIEVGLQKNFLPVLSAKGAFLGTTLELGNDRRGQQFLLNTPPAVSGSEPVVWLLSTGARFRTENDRVVDVDFEGNSAVDNSSLETVATLEDLRALNLGGTSVTDEGLEHISELLTLERLVFNGTPITDAGLSRLSKLENLKVLYMWDSTEITDEGLSNLSSLRRLEVLEMTGRTLTGSGLRYLESAAGSLKNLAVARAPIADAALDHVALMSALERLNLSFTNVTDAGIGRLHNLPQLERLLLEGTAITDAGLMELTAIAALRELDVRKTQVTAAGKAEFSRRRPDVRLTEDRSGGDRR